MANIFKKIFKSDDPEPQTSPDKVDTTPLKKSTEGTPTASDQTLAGSPKRQLELPQFTVGCGQSTGRLRDKNEDALFSLTTNIVADSTRIPVGLYIIADGMGGHQHGEIASGVTVRTVANHIILHLYLPLLGLAGTRPADSFQEIMLAGVQDAQRAITKDAVGGGTTLTAAFLYGDKISIIHVGDSRAYLYTDQHLELLTHDHSLVKRLEELGQITSEEAASHPQRNVLYRALGQGEPFEPDFNNISLPKSSILMLCSDGLWGVVNEAEIIRIIQTIPDPQQACQLLVDAANTAGGPDNISVIIVKVPE